MYPSHGKAFLGAFGSVKMLFRPIWEARAHSQQDDFMDFLGFTEVIPENLTLSEEI
jgi:hypothetical protein